MPTFTLTANCEIIIEVEADSVDEAIDKAYETPVGYWAFTSDYPDFVEEMGLPTIKELEDAVKELEDTQESENKDDESDTSGDSGTESPLLS